MHADGAIPPEGQRHLHRINNGVTLDEKGRNGSAALTSSHCVTAHCDRSSISATSRQPVAMHLTILRIHTASPPRAITSKA